MFDFGIGASELFVIAALALIVVGPKELPKLLRTIGQVVTKLRAMAREFQNHIEEAAKESGLDEVKKDVSDMTNFTVTNSDFAKQEKELRESIEKPVAQSKPQTTSAPANKPSIDKPTDAKVDTKSAAKKSVAKKPAAKKKAATKNSAAKKAPKKSVAKVAATDKPASKTAPDATKPAT